jgi:starch phosphorylase
MKVLPNGGLNLSVLDGWWCEAYQPGLGWAIGKGEDYDDHAYQDYVESNALYELLEKEIVPLFYARGADGLPRGWIARMKDSMRLLSPAFSTNRMVGEYADRYYVAAAEHFGRLSADGFARARALAAWKVGIFKAWPDVRIERVEASANATHRVGDGFEVRAVVRLGKIKPGEVQAEIYYGRLDDQQRIVDPRSVAMEFVASPETGLHTCRGTITCDTTGLVGYTVRVRPAHPDANNVLCTGLMTWR